MVDMGPAMATAVAFVLHSQAQGHSEVVLVLPGGKKIARPEGT